jgi:acyl-coenzyme A synthetase/AMP-(fatty) acid ligase
VSFLLLIGAIAHVPGVSAEISPAMLATFKVGTVTSVHSTSIGISGVEYRIKANVEILDHKGSEMKLAEVLLRSEARFHLDKNSEIDMMVVRRPQ